MALLTAYGIPHGVMLDDDNGQDLHGAVNDLVEACATPTTLAAPVKFNGCLEAFLGIPVPDRVDKKPVEVMKAITGGLIDPARLQALRDQFRLALALP
jgi:putative ATP-dependent endonuclease of the OLD family